MRDKKTIPFEYEQEERACERNRRKKKKNSVEASGALDINAENELARDLTHV